MRLRRALQLPLMHTSCLSLLQCSKGPGLILSVCVRPTCCDTSVLDCTHPEQRPTFQQAVLVMVCKAKGSQPRRLPGKWPALRSPQAPEVMLAGRISRAADGKQHNTLSRHSARRVWRTSLCIVLPLPSLSSAEATHRLSSSPCP